MIGYLVLFIWYMTSESLTLLTAVPTRRSSSPTPVCETSSVRRTAQSLQRCILVGSSVFFLAKFRLGHPEKQVCFSGWNNRSFATIKKHWVRLGHAEKHICFSRWIPVIFSLYGKRRCLMVKKKVLPASRGEYQWFSFQNSSTFFLNTFTL